MPKFPKPWLRKARGWYVTLDGVQIFLGPERKAAFAHYHELMRQPRAQRQVPPASIAVLVDQFLDWAQKNRAPHTYRWYQFRLQKFVRRYPDLTVPQLKPFHVQQWIDSAPHLKSGSKRNLARAIQRCLSWCEEMGLIEKNPIRHFKKPPGGKRTGVITPEEYSALLEAIPGRPFRDLVTFAWETGARAAECLAIERRHLELSNHRIVFPVDEEKMARIPRIIYLTPAAEEILRRMALQAPQGPIFRNTLGVPWTTQSVNCAFQGVQGRLGRSRLRERGFQLTEQAIAAKVKLLRPEKRVQGKRVAKSPAELRQEARTRLWDEAARREARKYCLTLFRHSFCHRLLKARIDALTVANLMGHADATMVTAVYSHMNHAPDFLLQSLTGAG